MSNYVPGICRLFVDSPPFVLFVKTDPIVMMYFGVETVNWGPYTLWGRLFTE